MPHNFPAQITTFVGRADELEAITDLLLQSDCRLLTLVGPGGIGKTVLAIHTAARIENQFRDGVYFVPLQSVTSAEYVLYAIADVLDIGMYGQEVPRAQLLQYLQHRQLLLVLDNFEHLLDAADLLVQIIESAPDVKLLITSREVLNIRGEQIFEVGGLAADAVQLFAARAARVRRDFDLVTQQPYVERICRLVGGMPLGIELAATWVRTLSCEAIADEVEKNVDFLSTSLRDMPERHRSMRAVFDHSWQLLSADEQNVYARLSIFQGKFTRDALEQVAEASLPTLSALVDQSLLRAHTSGYFEMHELLRQYAAQKFSETPADHQQTRQRHTVYYMTLLHTLDPKIKSGDQLTVLGEIDLALDNIRGAWNDAVDQRRSELILPAFECLTLYYQMRCRLTEGYELFALSADRYRQADDEITYAWLRLCQAWFGGFNASSVSTDYIHKIEHEVMDIMQRHHLRGLGAMPVMALWRAEDQNLFTIITDNLALFRAKNDVWSLAWSLHQHGSYLRHHSDPVIARPVLEESVALFQQLGDHWSATWGQAILGYIAESENRYQDAYSLYAARLRTCEIIGDTGGVAWSLQQIAKVSLEMADIDRARYYCRESLRVALEISSSNSINEAILRIVSILIRMDKRERAAELCAVILNSEGKNTYKWERTDFHLERLRAQIPPDIYARAIDSARGQTPRELGYVLLDELADQPAKPTTQHGIDSLSERELEVLRLTADGLSNREIAARLFVTVGTVKKHLNNIFGKLGVERRVQAISRARDMQLIP